MHLHYVKHVPFEGLGSIETWALGHGHEISCSRIYQGDRLPAVEDLDLLVLMGGPMSVNDDLRYPWLASEMDFVKEAIDAQKVILGICLGAQLIARVLGAAVYPNLHKEIGWFPITKVASASTTPFGEILPDELTVFHWHGETFDLPKGSIQLARSDACQNQAFIYGDRIVALQFHLETSKQSAEDLIKHCSDELAMGKYIQPESELLSDLSRFETIHTEMERVLDYLQAFGP